ncbi:MAG: DNA internalization-related competence protein ComEC/Rec2 [Betaproteobacteria bacterium]
MQRPIIPITLAYIAGLLLGHWFLYFPFSTILLTILGILISGILARFDGRLLRRFPLAVIPGALGIAAYLYSAAWFPSDHYLHRAAFDGSLHAITGRITSPLDRDPDRTGFVMEVSDMDDKPASGKVRVVLREQSSSIGYNDRIRLRGKLREPQSFINPGGFDYAEYLARSGVRATASIRNADPVEILSRGTGIFRTIQDWRERIRQAFLASTTGTGSAILQAMVLGEEGDLTDDIRDRFMAAGVTHIISISGSHLGMVAVLCFGLIRGLMFLLPERVYHRLTLYTDPKKIAAWLTLPLVIFYTLLAGGQVATVRSLIMISAGLMALVLDREHALMHSLTLAALVILIASPQAVFDISFQLSYLSVLVIGAVVTLWNELGLEARNRLQQVRNGAALLMIISLTLSLMTGPVVAHYFNQVSLAGIVSNLIIVPFAGIAVVPLGLFTGVVSLFTHTLPMAWLNQIAADIFIGAVFFFSRFPFAEFHPRAPGILWLACYMLFFLSLLPYARKRLLSRWKPFEVSSRVPGLPKTVLALSGTFLVLSTTFSFLPRHETVISFPDVGQGDCALIELASGKTILIDGGGTRDNRFDIGRRVVAPFLWSRGIRSLDLVILSHPHPDHLNGLLFLLGKFKVTEIWTHGLDTDLPGYENLSRVAAARHIIHRIISAEDPPTVLGDTELRVLHPKPGFNAQERKTYAAENNRSLVVRIADRSRVFLFPGDIGDVSEQYLIKSGQSLKCDVLKVPHHGSKSSSTDAFVSLARPEIAVVTVGRTNPYHHPSEDVIERYEKIGARICRTDTDGAVIIRTKQDRLEIARWSELVLRRITLIIKPEEWKTIEKQNWQRMWKRMSV